MNSTATRLGAAVLPLLLSGCAGLKAPEEAPYTGTIFSAGGLHPVTTVFATDARDATIGRYVFEEDDGTKVPGTLGPCEVRASGALRCEWEDRYGPVPPPGEALLSVARLRAECVRLGVREVVVTKTQARLSPVELRASQEVRLQRLVKGAILKGDTKMLVLPVKAAAGIVDGLVQLLRQVVPADAAPVASSFL